jgi:hypothetical protein
VRASEDRQRSRIAKLVALICLAWITACMSSVVGSSATSGQKARARFEVHISDFVSGSDRIHPDIIEMTLTNESSSSLWVNQRLFVAPPGWSTRSTEVKIEIIGPSGKLGCPCHRNIELPTEGSYIVLRPGERLTRTSEMWCSDMLDEPGTYTVRATYRDEFRGTLSNGYAGPPPPPAGADHLSEPVAAAPFQFQVLPTKAELRR